MRSYSTKISLTKNARGVYSLDPSFGCSTGMGKTKGGCFGECYAAKSAKLYGYDFSKTVYRFFEGAKHRAKIINAINKIPMSFIRMGTNGDPSENWEHTISILKQIDTCNKQIVIITKHWTNLTYDQLLYLASINVCINTSVCALDDANILSNCLEQHKRVSLILKGVLRVISCDFNIYNNDGRYFNSIQKELFNYGGVIDTILRISKNNYYYKNSIINAEQAVFLGKNALISRHKKTTYFGACDKCHEQCGVNLGDKMKNRKLNKQMKLL